MLRKRAATLGEPIRVIGQHCSPKQGLRPNMWRQYGLIWAPRHASVQSMTGYRPLDTLVRNLRAGITDTVHNDVVMTREGRPGLDLKPESFHPITRTNASGRVAFVDGGNGTVAESPNFVISLNRLYCGLFRGRERAGAPPDPRIEFFSLVVRRAAQAGNEYMMEYDVSLFPHDESHRRYMPAESDVKASIRDTPAGVDPRIPSLSRSLGEWRMAHAVVQTLAKGDILVMDGSLTTLDRIESRYAQDLYISALDRGVVVCALAKTSRLLTRGGEPLLDRVHEIAAGTCHGMWCIEVAEQVSSHDRGFVMAVKLHPNAAFPFRFEILREQFLEMDCAEKDRILSSVAANSGDVSFLGYPYGLVDADRYAQVRNSDVAMYRALLESRLRMDGDLAGVLRSMRAYGAHERLNGVSS